MDEVADDLIEPGEQVDLVAYIGSLTETIPTGHVGMAHMNLVPITDLFEAALSGT